MRIHAAFRAIALSAVLTSVLSACTNTSSYIPLLNAEPESGAVLQRPPRTLRLFFNALPDVELSSLTLHGPDGEYPLRGMHTMAADDLMVEIVNPSIPSGNYSVQWSTVVGADPTIYSGSIDFIVQAE
ncbi:MAG: copper resistance protein CopC [Gammaproteobacteria bacterium]|nr:copper resistance protein CopC [Gammaproteobacteria bacterium]